ncbi:hypothetical protein DCE79_10400 [Lysinibacillus sp. 2017]|uniref:hypothetical protein n=1 Tax=unclassified Lysinibacillus TaxID=2636778 RepID=UPI000D5291B1|nr:MULTISPECIES: hypothetical protein [unclassified Lysinibacillus]AWE07770.1 hypothetical protein DCE79_10400 [Lysinibacillus sp. 2017]TGN34589.1 hypothetical protein E4L99_13760 [Lysinibacillus sp. S2017]
MKKISLICVLLLLSLTTLFYVTLGKSTNGKAINEESEQLLEAISEPCSLILESVDKSLTNAKGVALIYKVQLNPPSFARTNISILAVHLPKPSSYGDFDSYEGFAFIPKEISWRFKLYPTPEDNGPSWAGRFDLITAEMKNVEVQVRLSNSKTNKLGPSVLTNNISYCK